MVDMAMGIITPSWKLAIPLSYQNPGQIEFMVHYQGIEKN